jgi:hypothetical protein
MGASRYFRGVGALFSTVKTFGDEMFLQNCLPLQISVYRY